MIEEKERERGGETRRMRRGREVGENHEHLTGRSTQGTGLPLLASISHFPSDQNRLCLSGSFSLYTRIRLPRLESITQHGNNSIKLRDPPAVFTDELRTFGGENTRFRRALLLFIWLLILASSCCAGGEGELQLSYSSRAVELSCGCSN